MEPLGENNIISEINHLVKAAGRIERMVRSSESSDLHEVDDEEDRESVRSERTLRVSSSISSLDSYMTCWESEWSVDEFDYAAFPFLHQGKF